LTVVIASTPETPTGAPYSDPIATTGNQVKVLFDAPSNGGSLITNYEVQMNNGLGSSFFTVAGGASQNYQLSYFTASSTG
jgi:hypothetical protein